MTLVKHGTHYDEKGRPWTCFRIGGDRLRFWFHLPTEADWEELRESARELKLKVRF